MTPVTTTSDTRLVSLRARSRRCHQCRIGSSSGKARRGRLFAAMTSTLRPFRDLIRRKPSIGYPTKVNSRYWLFGRSASPIVKGTPRRGNRVLACKRAGLSHVRPQHLAKARGAPTASGGSCRQNQRGRALGGRRG